MIFIKKYDIIFIEIKRKNFLDRDVQETKNIFQDTKIVLEKYKKICYNIYVR